MFGMVVVKLVPFFFLIDDVLNGVAHLDSSQEVYIKNH